MWLLVMNDVGTFNIILIKKKRQNRKRQILISRLFINLLLSKKTPNESQNSSLTIQLKLNSVHFDSSSFHLIILFYDLNWKEVNIWQSQVVYLILSMVLFIYPWRFHDLHLIICHANASWSCTAHHPKTSLTNTTLLLPCFALLRDFTGNTIFE